MTLFSLFWAALLPHYPVTVNPSAPLAVRPYTASYVHGQGTVAPRPYSYSPLPVQTPAPRPLNLYPQLIWPPEATVNWHRWSAVATVVVVAKTSATHKANGLAHLSLVPGLCGGNSNADRTETNVDEFAIQVNNVVIGQVPSRLAAEQVANQIRQAVPRLEAHPEGLIPSLNKVRAAGQVDGETVFVLPDLVQGVDAPEGKQAALQATQWVNNLRLAFGATPLDPSQVQMVAYGLGETHHSFSGTASWYGPYFHGRQTATGETFNQHDLTAAHKTLPFGTYLKVRNQLNGKTVVVRINDRGPYVGERSLDLSYAAAQCLGSDHVGVIPYQATILARGVPQAWRTEVVAVLP